MTGSATPSSTCPQHSSATAKSIVNRYYRTLYALFQDTRLANEVEAGDGPSIHPLTPTNTASTSHLTKPHC
ncbi:hypothetical protein GALMADRAFT_253520 [Galerina marginata CBS 339.88]|uniref:Uncharacterized protein n=1 Tax=Galerina marginata (strain CBS 339.88) TaxID=685588 RepID=A0A067SLE1_GALM3|nr:hypothetical protein GALMADRAFT_253520 [Galerina marginata CBS 339.88]